MAVTRMASRGARRQRRGFTLIEIALAITVLVVALLAMSASTLRMHGLQRTNRERVLAQNAVRTIAEEVRALARQAAEGPNPWAQTVRLALSPGGSLGTGFAVKELSPVEGQALVGTIELVLDETATDAELGVDLGMPRDLDGDGLPSSTNVGDAARVLPIVLRARWRGARGEHQVVHPFYVASH